jgi:transketolase
METSKMIHEPEEASALQSHFPYWQQLGDMIDQCLDVSLNLRQSGHPGGSRSKMHILLSLLLSGAMRWDIRNPLRPFADRFILAAGHTNPLVYATLAVLNESLRRQGKWSADEAQRQLVYQDLLTLRRRGGLPGHAEMAGKTMFFKFNTGPSGHGAAAAAGQALGLKIAGCQDVRVFVLEGEGGLTPGIVHETINSAYGLGLDNLFFLVDWNDYGIDPLAVSRIVFGTPEEWFGSHGWRVLGTEHGMDWSAVSSTLLQMVGSDRRQNMPNAAWFKTRKGRGYGVYDNKSHGVPHAMNSEMFWQTKLEFVQKYGVSFVGYNQPAPATEAEQIEQTRKNLAAVMSVYDSHHDLLEYTADRLLTLAARVPNLSKKTYFNVAQNPGQDPEIIDYRRYPKEMYEEPGTMAANRQGLLKFGAYVNSLCKKKYGRPLFIAMSADLAESTNIAGFAHGWQGGPACGVFDRESYPQGALLPQEITELANAGLCTGLASVNLAEDPYANYAGFFSACSTYGAFSYLKYGPMRLFSQMAQDCPLKLGKIIWVAGHSGPETADDSRTHFGIFSPGVTELFPDGHIINLYPWEHNEVPVMLSAALMTDVPLIALHLTRPAIIIPDRKALAMPGYESAACGAYILRDYDSALPRMGTIFVQGTMTTVNTIKILPELKSRSLNVKLVAAVSYELFMRQSEAYRNAVVDEEEWQRSTVISNAARRNMHHWLANRRAERMAMTSDWDDRWRSGGTVPEVMEEAHLSAEWLLKGIEKFVQIKL